MHDALEASLRRLGTDSVDLYEPVMPPLSCISLFYTYVQKQLQIRLHYCAVHNTSWGLCARNLQLRCAGTRYISLSHPTRKR